MPIERLVRPPELPRHKNKKRLDLSAMAGLYILALISFGFVAWTALTMAQNAGDGFGVVTACVIVFIAYIVLGAALCAFVLRRLAWWQDATLADAVHAKLDFVWTWPWSMARLLYYLLINHVIA